jgi:hypothetical protein
MVGNNSTVRNQPTTRNGKEIIPQIIEGHSGNLFVLIFYFFTFENGRFSKH